MPPYAPDFPPREPLWSKVKAWLRQVGARTREALWEAIGQRLQAVVPDECRHYFTQSGYSATLKRETL